MIKALNASKYQTVAGCRLIGTLALKELPQWGDLIQYEVPLAWAADTDADAKYMGALSM